MDIKFHNFKAYRSSINSHSTKQFLKNFQLHFKIPNSVIHQAKLSATQTKIQQLNHFVKVSIIYIHNVTEIRKQHRINEFIC